VRRRFRNAALWIGTALDYSTSTIIIEREGGKEGNGGFEGIGDRREGRGWERISGWRVV